MTMIRDRVQDSEEKTLMKTKEKTAIWVVSLPLGHLPDDDDPAWPSKTGQAD